MITTLAQHLRDINAPLILHDESRGKTATQFWQECDSPGTLMWWAARFPYTNSPETVLGVIQQIQTTLNLNPVPGVRNYINHAIACYGSSWRKHGPKTAASRKSKPDLYDAAVWASLAISVLNSEAVKAHPKQTATQIRTAMCRIIQQSLVCPWAETPESKNQV